MSNHSLKFEPQAKRFDTAIFYDIENLVGGYGDPDMSLSLRAILNTIQETVDIGGIAVQRAYANWGDRRFTIMKREINELGIEPIQVFGFSRFAKKNAADIQLVVDAVDLAYIRPAIKKFVVVSGDGGFAALANKLHEYGKTVIGCAYDDVTNTVFRSVCDDFVALEKQENEEEEVATSDGKAIEAGPKKVIDLKKSMPTSRMAKAMIQAGAKLDEEAREYTVEDYCRVMIQCLTENPNFANEAKHNGIAAKILHEAFMYKINNFPAKYKTLGFTKYSYFLRYLFKDSGLYVFRRGGDFKVSSSLKLDNYTREEYVDKHSLENYRDILGNNRPMFKLPDSEEELYKVADYVMRLADHLPLKANELIEEIGNVSAEEHEDPLRTEAIKNAVYSFGAANVFIKEPPSAKFPEQNLTLNTQFNNRDLMIEQLKREINQKLHHFLGHVDQGVMEQIIS